MHSEIQIMNLFSTICKHSCVINFAILLLIVKCESLNGHEIGLEDYRYSSEKASLSTLHFVAVIVRHGSRAPVFTFPNDPYPFYDKRFWPQGIGQLTNVGKRQMYNLGYILRERYSGYLPLVYYHSDTIASFNKVDRDFESLSCLLAALYPPVGEEIWNQNLLWQPIPSTVYEFDVCKMLKNDKCPKFKSEAMKSMATYNTKEAQNTSCILSYVSNHTGVNLTESNELFKVTDTLIMQEENGFKLPEWTKSVFPKELKESAIKLLNALYAGSNEILSLTAGPELMHIQELFEQKINGTLAKNSKMYIELGHDCILYSLLSAMGSPIVNEMAETSSYLTFELHKLYSSYIIEVFFHRSHNDKHPIYVNIEDCPSPCSLENFGKFIKKIAGTTSWDEACKLKSS